MLFKCLKRMIEKGSYESKEAMMEKISILMTEKNIIIL